MSKNGNGGNIFAADVCVHTHARTPGTHVHMYIDKNTRTRSPTHSLTHTHTGEAGCSECGSLGLALPRACGNSAEASSAVRPLPHAGEKTPSLRPRQQAIGSLDRFLSVHKSPYLREYPTGAAVFWRCIEVEGAGRAGEKNRRPTSHYAVQSCAIETVGRTILRTVGAKNGGDCCPQKGK